MGHLPSPLAQSGTDPNYGLTPMTAFRATFQGLAGAGAVGGGAKLPGRALAGAVTRGVAL
jgi:hypothetical protein